MALHLCLVSPAHAADYVSWLSVRYEGTAVKTFLQGPHNSKVQCEKLNETTWDNVLTACGICKVEQKFCMSADQLGEFYAKALRKERAEFPYVISTPKGRILFSGVPTASAVAECNRLAQLFRANGYVDARCVLH